LFRVLRNTPYRWIVSTGSEMSPVRAQPGCKRRLLVVDDDRQLCDLLVDALGQAGYEVMAAQSVTEALAAIATASPDLAVLDIKMPGTSGLTLSELLRDQFAIPFVFFSALDNEETVCQATMMGALAYLVKPLDMRHLVPAINAAVARADELRRLRQSESQLSIALQQNRGISVATGILMERLRLGRGTALEFLRRQTRARRQRMSQVAEDVVKSTEYVNGIGVAASQQPDAHSTICDSPLAEEPGNQ
jgi:AmiR/NasT family two-component response regulator